MKSAIVSSGATLSQEHPANTGTGEDLPSCHYLPPGSAMRHGYSIPPTALERERESLPTASFPLA